MARNESKMGEPRSVAAQGLGGGHGGVKEGEGGEEKAEGERGAARHGPGSSAGQGGRSKAKAWGKESKRGWRGGCRSQTYRRVWRICITLCQSIM